MSFKDKILEALKRTDNPESNKRETIRAMRKIQKQKRLSSEEFLHVHDVIWKDGPLVKYQNPNDWRYRSDSSTSP